MSRLQHDGVSKTGILSCTAHVLRAAVTLAMIHQASQGDSDNQFMFSACLDPVALLPIGEFAFIGHERLRDDEIR
jgi:hypothetical protein